VDLKLVRVFFAAVSIAAASSLRDLAAFSSSCIAAAAALVEEETAGGLAVDCRDFSNEGVTAVNVANGTSGAAIATIETVCVCSGGGADISGGAATIRGVVGFSR
jgi:hypothetical protein